MELKELSYEQELIVQLLLRDKKVEFRSKVVKKEANGIYITPYIRIGTPLVLNITPGKGVLCNLFADDIITHERISWRNIKLSTVMEKDEVIYFVTTFGFNKLSRVDERRQNDRIMIHKNGTVIDEISGQSYQVMVHDISDSGISFYAPASFSPKSNQITVVFSDTVENTAFGLKVKCKIVRDVEKMGMAFYGCRVMKVTEDHLLYMCTKRAEKRVD